MKDLIIRNVLTDEELDARIKKLASKNWKVKKFIEDCFGNQIKGVIHKWNIPSKEALLKGINVKEVFPGIYQDTL